MSTIILHIIDKYNFEGKQTIGTFGPHSIFYDLRTLKFLEQNIKVALSFQPQTIVFRVHPLPCIYTKTTNISRSCGYNFSFEVRINNLSVRLLIYAPWGICPFFKMYQLYVTYTAYFLIPRTFFKITEISHFYVNVVVCVDTLGQKCVS